MADYTSDKKILGLDNLPGSSVAAGDGFPIGDVSDSGKAKYVLQSEMLVALGLTATAAQLNRVDATSSIQTQLDGKQASGSYLTSANIVETITNGVTTKSPSENAVFDALALKQDVLVSGTNIKTINSTSLLGSGDIAISSGLTIGTTAITGSTATRLLKVNSDNTLGEYTITGSGTVVAMATSPTFTTPVLGAATGTSLGLGGALIGTLSAVVAPSAVTTNGVLNLGNGGFGGSAGHFVGNANGTVDAINITGSADFANWQKSGVSMLNLTNAGFMGLNRIPLVQLDITTSTNYSVAGLPTARISAGASDASGIIPALRLRRTNSNAYPDGISLEFCGQNEVSSIHGNIFGQYSADGSGGGTHSEIGIQTANLSVLTTRLLIGRYGEATLTSGFAPSSGSTAYSGVAIVSSHAATNAASGAYKPLNITYTIDNTGTASTGTATGIFLNATETALNSMVHNLMDLQAGASGGLSRLRADNIGNLFLGAATIGTSGTNTFATKIGTSPTTAPTDTIQIFAKDSSAGSANATLGLYLEQAVETGVGIVSTDKLRTWINGIEYYIPLTAV